MLNMHNSRITIVVAVFVLSTCYMATLLDNSHAQNITDDHFNPQRNAVINVPRDYSTIQQAIDAAQSGDTIIVDPGTYAENIVVTKNDIALVGHGNDTIIDGRLSSDACTLKGSNVSISGFTLINGNRAGILLDHAFGCAIVNNIVMNSKIGISLSYSNHCAVSRNVATNNEYNIHLDASAYNVFSGNSMQGTSYNFGLAGFHLSHFVQSIDASNTINGQPVCYLINANDVYIDARTWQNSECVIIVNSSRVTVKDLSVSRNVDGVLLAYVSDAQVENVTTFANKVGINLAYCSNVTVLDSNIAGNMFYGVYLCGSFRCEISRNNITGNNEGIYLSAANNSHFYDNLIARNFLAGITFDNSHNNAFLHNNIAENLMQIQEYNTNVNSFDNGFEGNYWSDYNGSDINNDGIGETLVPHRQDNFPLIGQFKKFNVKNNNITFQVETISNSSVFDMRFDQKGKSLSFTVSTPNGGGFARVVLPHLLLNGTYTILVNRMSPLLVRQESAGVSSRLYFVFPAGTSKAEIIGENTTVLIAHAVLDAKLYFNAPMHFNGNLSVSNRGITDYEWDFGDGTTASGAAVNHYYVNPGNYTAILTIKDAGGGSATDSVKVVVEPALESRNPLIVPRWLVLTSLLSCGGLLALTFAAKVLERRSKNKLLESRISKR